MLLLKVRGQPKKSEVAGVRSPVGLAGTVELEVQPQPASDWGNPAQPVLIDTTSKVSPESLTGDTYVHSRQNTIHK
jgi:hypothetical protein